MSNYRLTQLLVRGGASRVARNSQEEAVALAMVGSTIAFGAQEPIRGRVLPRVPIRRCGAAAQRSPCPGGTSASGAGASYHLAANRTAGKESLFMLMIAECLPAFQVDLVGARKSCPHRSTIHCVEADGAFRVIHISVAHDCASSKSREPLYSLCAFLLRHGGLIFSEKFD